MHVFDKLSRKIDSDRKYLLISYSNNSKNKNDFSILCQKIFFNCDDEALHSLYMFIFQNQLVNLPSYIQTGDFGNSMSTLPRRWHEDFISLLMLSQFRKVYKEIYKLEKPLYETIVNTAMLRTRIIICLRE